MVKIIACIVSFDQYVKLLIEKKFKPGEEANVKDKFSIKQCRNYGLMMNRLDSFPDAVEKINLGFLAGFTGFIAGLAQTTKELGKLTKTGAALIIGGGLSNLLDRFSRGYVVDYVAVKSKKLKNLGKVYFNIADVFVMLGGIIFATSGLIKLLGGKNEK